MNTQITFASAEEKHIDSWMELVRLVRHIFPGYETEEQLSMYRRRLERAVKTSQAICALDSDRVAGFILYSRELNMLCHMAVHPDYRRMGIASQMLSLMISRLDRTRDISVITFREDDEKGKAPRALYKSFGFCEDVLCAKFGYPEQRFVLPRETRG